MLFHYSMALPRIQEYLVFSFLNPTSYMKACPFVVSLFYLEDLSRQIGNQYGKNNANSDDNRKSPYRTCRHKGIRIPYRHFFDSTLVGICPIVPNLTVISKSWEAHDDGTEYITGPVVIRYRTNDFCQKSCNDQWNSVSWYFTETCCSEL